MKPARTACIVVALLAVTALPVLACLAPEDQKPPAERQVRCVSFGTPEQAERFFDAFNLVLECQGRRPKLDLTLNGDTVEIAGPPKLVRSAAALMGLSDKPQNQTRPDRVPDQAYDEKEPAAHQQHDPLQELAARAMADLEERDGPQVEHRQESAAELLRQLVRSAEEGRPDRAGRPADVDRPDRPECPADVERPDRTERREKREQARREERRDERGPDRVLRVFPLNHAHAPALVKLVDMLGAGDPRPWVVEVDERTNAVVVKGAPELVAEADQLINQLDQPGRREGHEPVIKLITLANADANVLAEVASRVGRCAMQDTSIVSDVQTNTLVLAGPPDQVARASSLIESLDVKVEPADQTKTKETGETKKGQQKAKKAKAQAKGERTGEASEPEPEAKPAPGPKPAPPAAPPPPPPPLPPPADA